MTHRGMPPEAQAEAGIHPDLLRLSVGLEDSADLRADLERGFSAT
jgi:cystathionine beta-lyase/cystathionine gamma-synthase